MAKRRRRKRGNGASWLMIVAIGLLIAGFMAHRLMMPPAARYLNHRAPDSASAPQSDGSRAANPEAAHSNDNGSGEHLNQDDRRALDAVIRRKTGSH